nr:tRNA (adenosine(37)-N6)-dimethylallyltransferase MiaA [uncultured Capnocytophaga sp.]
MGVGNRKTLLVVVGPTAIGKTRMAIELAKYYNTEIISCDSRQFFKELTIGTAVPSQEELHQVRHHFIQHKSIFESYSVGDFERESIILLQQLFEKHNVVVMVGGSGLYVKAVIKGLDTFPEVEGSVREYLNEQYQKQGITFLQKELKVLDPIQYQQMDIYNPQRMIRALEVCIVAGKPYSSFLNKKATTRDFQTIQIGLTADRAIVYNRIEERVEVMLEKGLLIEAQEMFRYRKLNALQTVGYRELFDFLDGKMSLAIAVEEIKKNTRRFAKRQYTWFNKDENIQWFDYEIAVEEIITALKENG